MHVDIIFFHFLPHLRQTTQVLQCSYCMLRKVPSYTEVFLRGL